MRLHPYTLPVRAISRGVQIGSTGFFVGAMLSATGIVEIDAVFVLAPVGFVLGLAYAAAYYLRFEYELSGDTFDVTSGVLARRRREIPVRRVQNVDVTQSIFQRLFDVAALRVETAGGGETEAELAFVSAEEARRIQRTLRELARGDAGEPTAGEQSADEAVTAGERDGQEGVVPADAREESTPLFSLAPRELALLCLVAFYPGAAVFVLLAAPFAGSGALGVVGDVLRAVGLPGDAAQWARAPLIALGVTTLSGALFLAVTWVVSAVFTFTGYYGFRLGRTGDDLVYERGLLQRYSGSIPLSKVQRLTVAENVLGRRLGYASLQVETAGYAAGGSDRGGGTDGGETAVPLARRERVFALARSIDGFAFEEPTFTRPSPRARRRYAARYALALGALAGALLVAARVTGFDLAWYLPLAGLPVVPVAAHYKWRHRGYFLGDDHVIVRTGFWRRRTRVVPYYRVQTVIGRATVFQRRLDLADLTADTASSFNLLGGHATAFDVEAATATDLRETIRGRLQAALRARHADREPSSGTPDGGE